MGKSTPHRPCPENKKLKGIVADTFAFDVECFRLYFPQANDRMAQASKPDEQVPNLRYCLYNHPNVEHTTKPLGQKMHPSKLPSIKGSKQNKSSLTDDGKLEPYDNANICTEVIDRALRSNDIPSIHHTVGAPMSLLFLFKIDQNMVMSDEMKQTNFNLVMNDPFSTYGPPETWPI
uniref:Uncharacterized protein n=1 Tax=Romanomermis culicivorax TaxID=13658 RepID=A0A915J2K8_ROMCU